MNAKALIRKKREGEEHTPEEIRFLIEGAVRGEIPPYQLTAWMMAVFFRGMTASETAELTRAMIQSGDRLDFSNLHPPPADKHSTGGVGDKISFLVAPLVAAAGVPVPMISGRSLGHTGGTLDKLESIPGLKTDLTPAEVRRQVERLGLCIAAQGPHLVPADQLLYGLRDAASLVESIPLITASILSKKAAAGVRGLALDVKVGEGAFMADLQSGRALGRALVETASLIGIRARADLTDMRHVLGRTAGNALEIDESVRALRGEEVSSDLRTLTLALGGSMLELVGAAATVAEGELMLERVWSSGAGYERFLQMVEAQGGDVRSLEESGRLPRAKRTLDVTTKSEGFFQGVAARPAGEWITTAGGGRQKTGDPIDPRIGLEILAQPGVRLSAGSTVFRLHLPEGPLSPALPEGAASWIRLAERHELPSSPLLETIDPPPKNPR